jgi:hypothetical protein
MIGSRLLALFASEGETGFRKLYAFRVLLMIHAAARSWLWLQYSAQPGALPIALSAGALTLCLALALHRRTAAWAPRLALPVLLLQLVWTFPLTDNHFFIELYCVLLVCLMEDDAKTEKLVLPALGWLAALILFQTGLQKVLYGQYFGGEFLSFMIGQGDRFADLFSLFVPADDIARLQSYDSMRTGSGPYRVGGWLLPALSNGVYGAELLLPIGLLIPKWRTVSASLAIALVVTIQFGAREFGFALLFSNLLLLLLPGATSRRLLPFFAAAYLYLIGAAYGVLPGGGWLEAGYL